MKTVIMRKAVAPPYLCFLSLWEGVRYKFWPKANRFYQSLQLDLKIWPLIQTTRDSASVGMLTLLSDVLALSLSLSRSVSLCFSHSLPD